MAGDASEGAAQDGGGGWVDADLEKGFTQVDAQADPAQLVAGMEETATFPAVRQLRAWEHAQLDLQPGQSLLDVGCGIGDVARSLAPIVGHRGRVVGIDASEAMLAVARERAAADGIEATFHTGDAMALAEPDASFDAVRSERMLQWVPDAGAAIAEMLRVLRPGGRLCVTDTDWRTIAADIDDDDAVAAISAALRAQRGSGAAAGGRLLNLCRDLGLVDPAIQAAAHVWTDWDPDLTPAPLGLFPIETIVEQLVALEVLDRAMADRFVTRLFDRARAGRLCISLTMISVSGRKP